jgi:hypothetical protein
MITMPRDCIIPDGVACEGTHHDWCSRTNYSYWREIWLTKVATCGGELADSPAEVASLAWAGGDGAQ